MGAHVRRRRRHRHHALPAGRLVAAYEVQSSPCTSSAARPRARDDLRPRRVLRRLRAARVPTTSQPSVGDFLAGTSRCSSRPRHRLVHLSGGSPARRLRAPSGHSSPAAGGAHRLDSRTGRRAGSDGHAPRRRPRRAAATRGFAAQRGRATGADLVRLDTLEFLRRGGRIGARPAWVGAALKVKPILRSSRDHAGRARAHGAAGPERMTSTSRRCTPTASTAGSSSTSRRPSRRRLVEAGREIFGTEPLFVRVGPVLGAHVGPGLIGAGAVPRTLVQ